MRVYDVDTKSSGEAKADKVGDGSSCTCCGAECRGCLNGPAWCPTLTAPGAVLAILLCCVGVLLGVLSASVLPWLDPSNRALPGACVVEARASLVPSPSLLNRRTRTHAPLFSFYYFSFFV